jgi:hypothetical protein
MNLHKLSTRAARYRRMKTYAEDIPGMIACFVAAGLLWIGTLYAGPVTEALGWVTP